MKYKYRKQNLRDWTAAVEFENENCGAKTTHAGQSVITKFRVFPPMLMELYINTEKMVYIFYNIAQRTMNKLNNFNVTGLEE